MNNDLISREALRKAFNEKIWYFDKASWNEANSLIDNAPTVEYTFEEAFKKTVCEKKLYCPARTHGEWIRTTHDIKGEHPQTACWYKCPVCNKDNPVNIMFNFCPNCGADMRTKNKIDTL